MFISALFLTGSGVISSTTTAPAAKQELRLAIGAVLRGQGNEARSALRSISPADLDAKDRQLRECALSRLQRPDPFPITPRILPGDTFANNLLALYQAYWRASVLDEPASPLAEAALVAGVTKLLGRPIADVSAAEPLIATRLKAAGLFSQEGRTGVFLDLMIWRRETHKVEQVALPESSNPTRVNYLDDFISRGWSSYFTCNRTGTGGWTTSDGLFVVVPSYDSLTDENFRVNFLAHESQHFADKMRFGDLPSWRLEFRAKLVEVAYADTTEARVLDNFISSQGDEPADPHSYANKRVLKALEDQLGVIDALELNRVSIDRLHKAAITVLKADSVALETQRGVLKT